MMKLHQIFPVSLLCLVLFLVLLPAQGSAQTPFALTNIGQRVDPGDARMVGRGGWGMAVSDSLHPGFKNLAGLSAIRNVVIKFSAYGDHVNSKDGIGERSTNRTISPDIRMALPVIKNRLAFSAGFEVTRSSQYRTLVEQTWFAWDDTLTGNEQFIREGSIWSVPLGLSFEVLDGFSIGGAVGLVNGTQRESVTNFFIRPANSAGIPLYLANGTTTDDEFGGTSVTVSALVTPFERLKLGASYCFEHDLNVKRKVEMGGVSSRYNTNLSYSIPEEFQAGFDLRLGSRWHVGGDYQMMSFSKFTGRDDWASDLEDEYTYSVGFERTQEYTRQGGWNNLPVRLGYQFRRWGYRVGGNPVEEKFFSIGTGFPFRQKLGQMDVAFSYGIIGGLADNGYESKVWRLAVSVTGLEKWW